MPVAARMIDFPVREDRPAYDSNPTGHVTVIADDVVDAIAEQHGLAALGLYLILDRMANKDGQCWPSESTLAARCGMSERHIRRIINGSLVPGGWVRKTEKTSRTGATVGILYTLPLHKNARTNGADITPDTGADMGADTTPARVSAKVVTSKREVEGSIPPNGGSEPTKTNEPKPLPSNGPVQELVKAWADAIGVVPANYPKALGHAKTLIRAGITPEDIPALLAYLSSEEWLQGRIDIGTAASQIDRFRAARTRPASTPAVPAHRLTTGERQSAARAEDRARRFAALNVPLPTQNDSDIIETTGRFTR